MQLFVFSLSCAEAAGGETGCESMFSCQGKEKKKMLSVCVNRSWSECFSTFHAVKCYVENHQHENFSIGRREEMKEKQNMTPFSRFCPTWDHRRYFSCLQNQGTPYTHQTEQENSCVSEPQAWDVVQESNAWFEKKKLPAADAETVFVTDSWPSDVTFACLFPLLLFVTTPSRDLNGKEKR